MPFKNKAACGLMVILLAFMLLMTGCGMGSWFSDDTDTNLGKRVALLPFVSLPEEMTDRVETLQNGVSQELAQDVILVAEHGLQNTVDNPGPAFYEAARRLGLTAVVQVRLNSLSTMRELTGIYGFRENTPFALLEAEAKIFDIANGVVAKTKVIETTFELDELDANNVMVMGQPLPTKALDPLIEEMIEPTYEFLEETIATMPYAAYVLETHGDDLVVSIGSNSGLSKGTELWIRSRGEKIKSGQGYDIYLPGPKVARIRLTEMDENTSKAVVAERLKEDAVISKEMLVSLR